MMNVMLAMPIAHYLAQSSQPSVSVLSERAVTKIISDAVYGQECPRRVERVDVIRTASIVADGTAIFLLDGQFVMFLSSDEYRDAADQQRSAMVSMKKALGDELGERILPVVAAGSLCERSFLVLPICKPLMAGRIGRRLQRPRITRQILPWLRALAMRAGGPEEDSQFAPSLQALAQMDDLRDDIRQDAKRLQDAIETGALKVRHSPMHGDLWRNNIMERDGRLVVIDWAGSARQGYAMYDLLRFHQSFGLSGKRLGTEMNWYIETLGSRDAVSAHLLGALGHYAIRMGEFPRDRFLILAADCYSALQSGLDRSTALE